MGGSGVARRITFSILDVKVVDADELPAAETRERTAADERADRAMPDGSRTISSTRREP
jgi:hypothetical protein